MPQDNTQSPRPDVVGATGARTHLYAPLFLKVFVALILALTPPAFVASAYLGAFTSIFGIAITSWLPMGTVVLSGHTFSAVYLMLAASFLVGLLLGFVTADILFIHRARRVLAFVLKIRSASFASVPLMPQLGHDEIGEIGRQVAYSSVYFSQVGEVAKGATEQRSLFIMTAAHQLRTPLTGLIWTIEQLQKNEMPAEERMQLLQAVDGSIRRMRLVIEHILASANVEEGRFGYVFEQVDVVPILQKIINEVAQIAAKGQLKLAFENKGAFPVYADKERISLALSNIISNALQYTPAGGSVTVTVAPQGEKIEIAIADTGIGF